MPSQRERQIEAAQTSYMVHGDVARLEREVLDALEPSSVSSRLWDDFHAAHSGPRRSIGTWLLYTAGGMAVGGVAIMILGLAWMTIYMLAAGYNLDSDPVPGIASAPCVAGLVLVCLAVLPAAVGAGWLWLRDGTWP